MAASSTLCLWRKKRKIKKYIRCICFILLSNLTVASAAMPQRQLTDCRAIQIVYINMICISWVTFMSIHWQAYCMMVRWASNPWRTVTKKIWESCIDYYTVIACCAGCTREIVKDAMQRGCERVEVLWTNLYSLSCINEYMCTVRWIAWGGKCNEFWLYMGIRCNEFYSYIWGTKCDESCWYEMTLFGIPTGKS